MRLSMPPEVSQAKAAERVVTAGVVVVVVTVEVQAAAVTAEVVTGLIDLVTTAEKVVTAEMAVSAERAVNAEKVVTAEKAVSAERAVSAEMAVNAEKVVSREGIAREILDLLEKMAVRDIPDLKAKVIEAEAASEVVTEVAAEAPNLLPLTPVEEKSEFAEEKVNSEVDSEVASEAIAVVSEEREEKVVITDLRVKIDPPDASMTATSPEAEVAREEEVIAEVLPVVLLVALLVVATPLRATSDHFCHI